MGGGLNLKLFGFPVRIRWAFFLGAVLLGWGRSDQMVLLAWWVFAVGVFVAAHELGHAFAFRRFGHQPAIEIRMFGGVTTGTPGMPLSPKQEIVVSFAGPAVGLLIGGSTWLALRATEFQPTSKIAETVINDILLINVGWSVFNLVPMMPLDGGNLFNAAMRHVAGEKRGQTIGLVVSLLVASSLVWWAIESDRPTLAVFCVLFALQSFQGLRSQSSGRGASAIDAMIDSQLREKRYAEALATIQSTVDKSAIDPFLEGFVLAQNGMLEESIGPLGRAFKERGDLRALSLLVRVLIDLDRLDGALQVVDLQDAHAIDDHALRNLAFALFRASRWEDSRRVSALRFQRFNDPSAAYNMACALSKMGRYDEAKRELQRALDAGYRDLELLDRDDDLAELRAHADLSDIRAKMDRMRHSDPAG